MNAGGKVNTMKLTANKILRRRDMPLSRQQWLFGEQPARESGAVAPQEDACISRE